MTNFMGLIPLYRKRASTLSCLIIMFFKNFLIETAGQIPSQGFGYESYEVTIPRKLSLRYREQENQGITYLLQIEGKSHILFLRQIQGLFPKQFPVFTYKEDGELHVDYPFVRDDCFYHGVVQGIPSSLVTLSTCSGGLRGVLRFKYKMYEIEPVPASVTFQHVVYRLEDKEAATHMICGLTEEEQKRQEAMMQGAENEVAEIGSRGRWWTHIRYVKLAVVVEHERFVKFDRNETLTILHVLDVIHTANSLYDPIPLQLSLAGLEIWSIKNLIEIADTINDTLLSFTRWRRDSLIQRLQNDAGHLFVYKRFGTIHGLAYLGTICDKRWGSAVESYMTSSLFNFSNTFAHELGHILGMKHDKKYCSCDQDACIMNTVQILTDQFSNCSYKNYLKLRNSYCLLIPPDLNKIYTSKYCGNKVMEKGEQCDCGSKAECELDPCCQSNCILRSGATCAFGQCCAKCHYLPAQSICREKNGICDLPEYCNGTSQWCPDDVYIQDGTQCSNGAFCYHGNCTTHSEQCKTIFGNKAKVASESCFRKINVQGNRFGNCGIRYGIYNKCNAENILCGRIQCHDVDILPSLAKQNSIIQSHASNGECWGTVHHRGKETADIGAVKDGTPCGTDKMCIERQCVNVSLLKNDCDVSKCHNRGVCNSRNHCHCDYGWAPPNCLNKGSGGSIDSGPPAPQKHNMSFTRKLTILGIVYICTVAVVWTGVIVYFKNKLIDQFRRLRTQFHPTELNQEEST
ncbi:disintegrin and metalloproteinase domain-containing protein 21-like [Anolis sagrei]|uniref:disintegrin and metalloproteinase domain-containing protein 21-like n=1 Tax=Anolis sagrei TaxID=38937 RepID=UPI0035206FA5